jgi:ribosome modulation factor
MARKSIIKQHQGGNGSAQGDDIAERALAANSELTDDERRVLTYHHKRKLDEIEARLDAVKAEKRAAEDLAKAELGKGAIKDIKDLRLLEKPKGNEAMQADIERSLRLARWSNSPVGSQFTFFEDARTEKQRAYDAGKHAGLTGQPKKPPYDQGEQYNAWCEGWNDGYEVVLSDFRDKLKPLNADDDEQMDLSERDDLPPEGAPNKADVSDPPFLPPADDLSIPENLRRAPEMPT